METKVQGVTYRPPSKQDFADPAYLRRVMELKRDLDLARGETEQAAKWQAKIDAL